MQEGAEGDNQARTRTLQVARGAMSLLTMVAAVSPDAAADHLDVILQVRLVMLSCCMDGLLEAHTLQSRISVT